MRFPNTLYKKSLITLAASAAGFILTMPLQTNAGTLDIATNALEVATGVEPNVMILADDSGSMDWTILAAADQGTYTISNPVTGIFGNFNRTESYLYTFNDGDNFSTNSIAATPFGLGGGQYIGGGLTNYYTLPTETALNTFNANVFDLDAAGYTNWRGVWRVRNADYNTTYYNPDVEYKPWAGVDNSGTLYSDRTPAIGATPVVSITAAPVDPYLTGSNTVNLTTDQTLNSHIFVNNITAAASPADFYFNLPDTQYPASYYIWTDTDGDGDVDEGDAHELIQLRASGATNGATLFNSATHDRSGLRSDCGGNGEIATPRVTCTLAEEQANFANWFTYYRRRELTAKAAITRVVEPETAIRVGMATINNVSNNRVQVASMNGSVATGDKRTLFDRIFQTQSAGGTPLRRNLERVGEYFACNSGNIFGTASSNPGDANCPVAAAPAGQCQQNYTILMTDGFWNGGDPNVNNADGDGTNGGTPQGPFDGASFADNFNDTLADVAMHYYERDLHSTLDDIVPITDIDEDRYVGGADPFEEMHQHMSTYTIGFGVSGTRGSNPQDPAAAATFINPPAVGWPDPTAGNAQRIDDLRHAAWNGRGQFLNATDQTQLTNALATAFADFNDNKGAATSVAFNTQNLESGAVVFRAFFDTEDDSGQLIAQSVDVTGVVNTTTNLWDASLLLDSNNAREIITFNADTNAGIPFRWDDINATQKSQLEVPSITANPPTPALLAENRLNYLRGDVTNEGTNREAGEFRERNPREGEPNPGGKLGDIIHSSPVFVGPPPFAGRDTAPYPDTVGNLYSEFASSANNRRPIVYIGANDGMLHGFDANSGTGGGEEVFAYVPNILFPKLSNLTLPDYTHEYFVDLTAAINDVFFQPSTGTNAGIPSWNTVMVGGLGAGSPGYFAMNITDPGSLDSEATASQNVMWEFTQADDLGAAVTNNDRNLGVAITSPLITMSNIQDGSGNNRWVAIFGNGYNSASTDGNAELYIAFLDGGLDGTWDRGIDFFKLNTGFGKAQSADNTTPNSLGGVRGIDIDANGTVDVVYAGDYQGNVFRFDLSGTSVATIQSSNSTVRKLFTASYNGAGTPVQPITNTPLVVKHPNENGYIVIVGTGSYFTNTDLVAPTSQEIQSIYGLWDDFTDPAEVITAAEEVTYSRLQEQVFTNDTVTGNIDGTPTTLNVRTLTNNIISFWGHSGGPNRKEGWVIDLDVAGGGGIEFPGEKPVRNFLIRNGFVFVNTVIPKDANACTIGPGGFELGFNPINGGSGSAPIFDINNDGTFDENDNIGQVDNDANIVTGIRFDKSTPSDSSFIGNRKFTQTSDQKIRSVGVGGETPSTTGRHSWREIEL